MFVLTRHVYRGARNHTGIPLRNCFRLDTQPGTTFPVASFKSYGSRTMNRGKGGGKAANAKPKVPDYCDVEPVRDADGKVIWPATTESMTAAADFIREW